MKKSYRILLYIFISEFFIAFLLGKNNLAVESWLGKTIGAFILLLPVEILLFLISKDEAISNKKRMFSKIAFWYVLICYILAGIATFIASQHS